MKIMFNAQKVYSLIVAYMLSFLALLNLGNGIFNLLGVHIYWDTVFLYGMLLVLVLWGIVLAIMESKYVKIDILFLLLFLVISFVFSILMFPLNVKYIFTSWFDYSKNPIYVVFLYSLPGYIFVRKLEDYDHFKRLMKKFSYTVVVMSIIVFFFAKDSSAAQYMTFSYNMLTQLFFLMICKPQKNIMVHYIIVGAGVFVFIFGGARGALISLIIAGIIFYFSFHNSTKKNIIICSLIVIMGIFFGIFKSEILLLISNTLEALSIDSRTFQFLLNGELMNDSNRFELYDLALKNIDFIGKGIMGDRVVLDSYPHNLFLEILVHFGWILGIAIIIFLCYSFGRALLKKSRPEFIFIILFMPCGFFKLMVTGSYLAQEPAFYILLGFCLNSIIRSDNYANTNDQHSICSR